MKPAEYYSKLMNAANWGAITANDAASQAMGGGYLLSQNIATIGVPVANRPCVQIDQPDGERLIFQTEKDYQEYKDKAAKMSAAAIASRGTPRLLLLCP